MFRFLQLQTSSSMEDWRLPWTSKCLTCLICPKNETVTGPGLLEELRKNPTVFNMFVSEEIPLQAKDLCTLFDVDFSVQGRNRRDRENMTICFWRDWLIDIQGILFIVQVIITWTS